MTTVHLSGRTTQTLKRRLQRNGLVVTKIKFVKRLHSLGSNEYKVTYHKKKRKKHKR